ncbi:MAG: hypothetical protein LC777_10690, partial [Actinobacteria bacterium]|nr:hypothetical protein [Actinomycetota bacterium]
DAGQQLRKLAAELDGLAQRYGVLLGELEQLQRRALYEIPFDELARQEEYFAVIEIDYSAAREDVRTASVREDVSCYFARALARRGRVSNAFRVVAVIDGETRAHVAEYPGEGDVDEQ